MVKNYSNWNFVAVLGLVTAFAFFAVFAVTTPLFESPDENAHLANICHTFKTGEMPDAAPVVFAANGHRVYEGHQMPGYYLLATGLAKIAMVDPCEREVIPNDSPRSDRHRVFLFDHPNGSSLGPVFLSDSWGSGALFVRLIGVLFGAVAVCFTWGAARIFFPYALLAAILSAAFVAFNPQFAFISGTVSNDSAGAMGGAFALYVIARLFQNSRVPTYWSGVVYGAVIGCGILLKASVLFLTAPFFVWVLLAPRITGRRTTFGYLVHNTFGFLMGVSALSGWVFLRNAILRGDPTLWKLQLEMLPNLIASGPPDWGYFKNTFFPVTLESFWGLFGWMNIRMSPWLARAYFWLSLFFGLVVVVGLVLSVLRASSNRILGWVLLSGVATTALGLLLYNITFRQPQGRLLFPAIAWIAVGVSWSIESVLEALRTQFPATTRYRSVLSFSLIAVLVVFALWSYRDYSALMSSILT